MESVGIRQLKSRLSEYVRRVQQGEEIRVTSHGQVVAELVPPTRRRPSDPPEGLQDLVRRGLTGQVVRNDPGLYATRERVLRAATASELLDDGRRDRR